MTLINTNGMAFIGPGSEWFWAALQFTALAITFIAIYRQLRIARSQRAVEQVAALHRQFEDERMYRHQLAILVAVRDKLEIPIGSATIVGNYFEGLGSLSRSGHHDIKLLWSLYTLITLRWWTVLEPFVRVRRAEQENAFFFSDFEWLVGVFIRMNRRHNEAESIDLAKWLASGSIEGLQDRIRIEQALRSVVIASSDSLDIVQSAAAAPATVPPPSPTAEHEQRHQSD